MSPSLEIEPGPHWWVARALTTATSLSHSLLHFLALLASIESLNAMVFNTLTNEGYIGVLSVYFCHNFSVLSTTIVQSVFKDVVARKVMKKTEGLFDLSSSKMRLSSITSIRQRVHGITSIPQSIWYNIHTSEILVQHPYPRAFGITSIPQM